jgi:hypothetical protein
VIVTGRALGSCPAGLLAFVLVVATLGAGCGSGDGDGDSVVTTIPTSSITKAEFVKRANAICKPGSARLLGEVTAYQKKHINEVSVKLIPNAARTVVRPALLSQVDQIRRLGAPRGEAGEIEEFFATLLRQANQMVNQKDATTFKAAEGMLQPANDIARRYGIEQCQYTLVAE